MLDRNVEPSANRDDSVRRTRDAAHPTLHGPRYWSEPAESRARLEGLLRDTHRLFAEGEFARLIPRARVLGPREFGPICETERIAFEFLAHGGKRFRPFITLAAYHAMTEEADLPETPDAVKRAAIAIEVFHKASLVHDDIEDDDLYRYGRHTMHRQYDAPTAINVGDYLVGLGYRLITGDRQTIGSDRTADILHHLMDAHVRLSEGQGAELAWRRAADKSLRPQDAIKIYALKTSPAFEAALYTGVRMAQPAPFQADELADFSLHLGVAFQILNDLRDWQGDDDNKLIAGQDALAMRPTLLLALAHERAGVAGRRLIEQILESTMRTEENARRLCDLFDRAGIFTHACQLVEEERARAVTAVEAIDHPGLARLLRHLLEAVLAGPDSAPLSAARVGVPDRSAS